MGTLLVLFAKVGLAGLPSVGGEARMIRVRLFPQHSSVVHLDQVDFSGKNRTFFVDRVEFPVGEQLSHPSLGNLGYKTDFGMELSGKFDLPQAGNWLFEVASDDGFALKIDGVLVGERRSDGAQEKTVLKTPLASGRHEILLTYFQGFGPMGLTVKCKRDDSPAWHVLGKKTGDCRFLKQ